jgi:hypothetical protein
VLPGTITFGTGINADTKEVTGPTSTFVAGTGFAHSIKLTQTFATNSIEEEITRIADGVVVQARGPNGTLQVTPSATIAGFTAGVNTTKLIEGWGKGEFVMRIYRGADLLAEGHFTLS